MDLRGKKIGLALGSGGVKGLSHIGVLKSIERAGIEIDYISGSSIGAIIGGYYAAFKDVSAIEEIALEMANWKTGLSLTDPTFEGGVLKGEKAEKYLEKLMKGKGFEDLLIPFAAVATDLKTGEEVDITSGNLVRAIRSSFSVPAFFKPANFKGRIMVDGGLCNPVPDNVVKNMGADIVIAVNLDSRCYPENISRKKLTFSSVSQTSLNIMRYHLAKYCIESADIVIEPNIEDVGILGWDKFFNRKKAIEYISKGEKIANKVISKLNR